MYIYRERGVELLTWWATPPKGTARRLSIRQRYRGCGGGQPGWPPQLNSRGAQNHRRWPRPRSHCVSFLVDYSQKGSRSQPSTNHLDRTNHTKGIKGNFKFPFPTTSLPAVHEMLWCLCIYTDGVCFACRWIFWILKELAPIDDVLWLDIRIRRRWEREREGRKSVRNCAEDIWATLNFSSPTIGTDLVNDLFIFDHN